MNVTNREVGMEMYNLSKRGIKYRAIGRQLGRDRRTVKKYAENPWLIGKTSVVPKRKSKLDSFKPQIRAWLEEDCRLKASWMYDRLSEQGYTGGKTILRDYVRQLKKERSQIAYVRFETEPGHQAQVDYGQFNIDMPFGGTKILYLFAMILGYSRMLYAQFVEKCDMVSFLESNIAALEYFNGVPEQVIYDRMRNVFIKKVANQAKFTQGIITIAHHYMFQPDVTPAYSPWVKGKIERPIDFIREGFWRNYNFRDIETANADLLTWLEKKNQRVHGTTHDKIIDRFTVEKRYLNPLPLKPCDVSEILTRRVWKDLLVHVETNRYVVPDTGMVGKNALIRLKDGIVRIYDDNRLIVTYKAPEGKGNIVGEEYYKTLRKDPAVNARKFHVPRKGRAKLTISPSNGQYHVDVQIRDNDIYGKIGGHIGYA